MSTLFNSSVRTARKNHRCIWCGEQINQKSYYVREVGEYNGDFFNQKWHPECKAQMLKDRSEAWTEFEAYDNQRPKTEQLPVDLRGRE